MDGFGPDDWSKLTDAQRVKQCRTAAREADSQAQSAANPETRKTLEGIAAQWLKLAAEIERRSKL